MSFSPPTKSLSPPPPPPQKKKKVFPLPKKTSKIWGKIFHVNWRSTTDSDLHSVFHWLLHLTLDQASPSGISGTVGTSPIDSRQNYNSSWSTLSWWGWCLAVGSSTVWCSLYITSRGNKYQLRAKSCLREQTEHRVFLLQLLSDNLMYPNCTMMA